jgi:hypothetical protein
MTNPVLSSDLLVGVAEDVSDDISMISPTATPFLTMIGTRKVSQKVFTWLEDVLDAAAVNAAAEGADAPTANQVEPTLFTGNTQILTKAAKVTGTTEATKLHGRGSEMGRMIYKRGREIKRDLEFAMTNAQAAVTSGTRKLASLQTQIDSSMTVAAATAVLTEQMILAGSQACYDQGADPNKLMISSANATVVADFAGATGRLRDLTSMRKIVNAVDVYVTPFGELTVIINRIQRNTDALIFDPSYWKRAVLRNWLTKNLPETGDYEAKMILGEFGLMHSNAFADYLITGLKVPAAGGNT